MASRSIVPLAFAGLLLLILAAPAPAQSRAPRASAPMGAFSAQATRAHAAQRRGTAPPFVSTNGRFGRRERHRHGNGLFFYPGLFPDYYEPVETEEPPVEQHVVVQQPAAAPAPAKPIEPLVLEERDGQWVRVATGTHVPLGESSGAKSAQGAQGPARVATAELPQTAAPLPAAVLVFRDGHREKVSKYMIEGKTLYVSADYWTTGSWSRRIPLSELDIPASLRANAERGTEFKLPRGPNEVVVRF